MFVPQQSGAPVNSPNSSAKSSMIARMVDHTLTLLDRCGDLGTL